MHREARKAFLALSEDAKAPVAGPTQAEADDDMASAAEFSTDGVSQLHKSTPVRIYISLFSSCSMHHMDFKSGDWCLILFFFQVYVLNPKQDMHGLGYDPFKGAPEFRGMYVISRNSPTKLTFNN